MFSLLRYLVLHVRKLLIDIPRTQVHCKQQGTRVSTTFKDCLGNKSIVKQKRNHRLCHFTGLLGILIQATHLYLL